MNLSVLSDEYFMKEALKEAYKALEEGEIPIGAVIVCKNIIIARAHNQVEKLKDATAHAEMLALTAAMESLNAKYLNNCILYVTVEPCVMCAGAMHWAQLDKIVFGTGDIKKGYRTMNKKILHPKTKLIKGVLKEPCSELLIDFFTKKRDFGTY